MAGNDVGGGGGGEFTCYDVLTKGVGPACLLLVVLSRSIRSEPSVAVKPAAAVALAALLLEPLFSAYVLGGGGASSSTVAPAAAATATATRFGLARLLLLRDVPHRVLGQVGGGGGRRRSAAAAATAASASAAASAAAALVARARWLTAGAQLVLWAAVVLAYANVSLRLSRGPPGKTVGGYMSALRSLAAKKRGTGGWVRIDQWGTGGGGGGGGCDGSGGGGGGARANGLLGSLYETLMGGGGWGGGGRICSEAMAVSRWP